MTGTVVEAGKLLEVILWSLCATVGVATLFSLAIFGASRMSERRLDSKGAAAGFGALAVVCLAGCLLAAAYGIVLLTRK